MDFDDCNDIVDVGIVDDIVGEIVTCGGALRPYRLVLATNCRPYYHRDDCLKSGVRIVVCEYIKYRVMTLARPLDRVNKMKHTIEGEVWNSINCYAPQSLCTVDGNIELWDPIDSDMQTVPSSW